MNYQYDNAFFTLQVTRKHFFRDKNYTLYLFQEDLIMTDNISKSPKYCIKLNLTTTLRWLIEGQRIIAFEFTYQNRQKAVHANPSKLQLLKEMIGGKVFYFPIIDFYTFQMQLGKGMLGEVSRCVSKNSQELFAVKKIEKEKVAQNEGGIVKIFYQNQYQKPQFIHELQIMSCLQHNNIVKLKEVYTDTSSYYIVMEYIDGKTLQQELQSRPYGYSIGDAIRIMQQLLDAIIYIHEKGIMHRDLNPLNIMRSNLVKIIDFGLARKVKNTIIFPTSGTPGYMAPEIINFQKVYDERADIYSLGCVLYKILTGEHLFGRSKLNIYQANKEGQYELKKQPNHPEINTTKMDQLFVLMQYMLEADPINRLSAKVCLTIINEIENNNTQIERLIKKVLVRKQLTFSTSEDPLEKPRSNDKLERNDKGSAVRQRSQQRQSVDCITKKSTDEMSIFTQKQKQANVLIQPNMAFQQKRNQ